MRLLNPYGAADVSSSCFVLATREPRDDFAETSRKRRTATAVVSR